MNEFPEHLKGALGELLATAGRLEQTVVNGNSMAPALLSGDTVRIRKTKDIGLGDIILFKRSGGRFLHRVVRIVNKKSGAFYITKGDNSPHLDIPVPFEAVEGKVIMVERGDEKIDLETAAIRNESRKTAKESYRRGSLYMRHIARGRAAGMLKEAHLLLDDKMPDEALALLQNAYPLDPKNPSLLFYYGVALFRTGELDPALEKFDDALKLDPGLFLAHTNKAEILRREKRFDEALVEIKKALDKTGLGSEVQAYAHNLWGNVLCDQEKYEEAVPHYKEALKTLPDYASCHLNMGWAFEQIGELEKAEDKYSDALTLRQDDPKIYRHLGCLFLNTGRPERAEKVFLKAREHDATDAHILNNLGVARLELGKKEEAIVAFTEAYRLDPENRAVIDNLASLGKRVD